VQENADSPDSQLLNEDREISQSNEDAPTTQSNGEPRENSQQQLNMPHDPTDIVFENDDIKLYIERGNSYKYFVFSHIQIS
jgi:hypothetical protein